MENSEKEEKKNPYKEANPLGRPRDESQPEPLTVKDSAREPGLDSNDRVLEISGKREPSEGLFLKLTNYVRDENSLYTETERKPPDTSEAPRIVSASSSQRLQKKKVELIGPGPRKSAAEGEADTVVAVENNMLRGSLESLKRPAVSSVDVFPRPPQKGQQMNETSENPMRKTGGGLSSNRSTVANGGDSAGAKSRRNPYSGRSGKHYY